MKGEYGMVTVIGLEMPKHCGECPMLQEGMVRCVLHDGIPAHKQNTEERPGWCPMVNVYFPTFCRRCGERL